MIKKIYLVIDKTGIHARPATILVSEASKFKSEILINYQAKQANVKSIMSLMSLGIPQGAEVTISFEGVDEEEAFSHIESEIIESKLCEVKV
ncbi:phosphocarrier protein HPr [Salipaludibacillus sp. HK11]|uniref:phosphocarrier protein HPr n=1 Tax=Salipaludibacillus sp. HK11 TaxID=3394320 RepID=UPI0039FBB840